MGNQDLCLSEKNSLRRVIITYINKNFNLLPIKKKVKSLKFPYVYSSRKKAKNLR